MEDKHIVKLLLQRVEAALAVVEAQYGRRLYAIAMNILGDDRDAQECVNDTYLALWNNIPPEKPDPLSAYACRISRNLAYARLRGTLAQKRNSRYDLSLEELAECIGESSLEDTLSARELGQAINRFAASLSRENRVIFLRRHWFGDSVRDIAADLGLDEGAVSTRLSRIRSKLKAKLIKEEFIHG